MLRVQLIGEFKFSNEDLIKRDYKKSIMTDCWMQIIINDVLLFDDWICPLEFYFQYLIWKQNVDDGKIYDFEYISDDNGTNPILSFRRVDNTWSIFSCLSKEKTNCSVSTDELLELFKLFEAQLLKHRKR